MPISLFDVFGNFGPVWPVRRVQPEPGLLPFGTDHLPWLQRLNRIVSLHELRTGVLPGDPDNRVAVQARVGIGNETGAPEGWRFVLSSLPDVQFNVQPLTAAEGFAHLFLTTGDRGVSVVIEGLPVEIRLPAGLVTPPDNDRGAVDQVIEGDDFEPGELDSQRIVYRRHASTSVWTHIRVRMDEEGRFTLRPTLPINFGKCRIFDVPALAVYDFNLFPSPDLVYGEEVEWVRHPVTPFVRTGVAPEGLVGIRSIALDASGRPFAEIADQLNRRRLRNPAETQSAEDRLLHDNPQPEFVLEDLVFPLFSPLLVPIPRHLTAAIRRRVIDPNRLREALDFNRAPVRIALAERPTRGLVVERASFRSEAIDPAAGSPALQFLSQIQLAAGIFSEQQHGAQVGGELQLAANVTPRLSVRRIPPERRPDGPEGTLYDLTHFTVAGMQIDIVGLHVGYSLGRALGEGRSFLDSLELTVDLLVRSQPSGSDSSSFRVRTLRGEPVSFRISSIGWRDGWISLSGARSPEGVVASFGASAASVDLIIREVASVAEGGATYVSISGGLAVPIPCGFRGRLEFRRLRLWAHGDPTAPPFKLDGFYIALRKEGVILIEFGGSYTDEVVGVHRRREFSLTGAVRFNACGADWLVGGDFLKGDISSAATPPSTRSQDNFDYTLISLFFRGAVTISMIELRGAQFLLALNLQPQLEAPHPERAELAYYEWYKRSNPLYVSGNRSLAAWNPRNGTFAVGVGAQGGLVATGRALELGVFVLVVGGAEAVESGFMIALELRLLSNPQPVGWAVLEYDARRDTVSFVAGVEIGIGHFIDDPPEWLRNIARLTGTIFFTNRPFTLALGRLRDMNTWLTFRFEFDAVVRGLAQAGYCLEWTEGGSKGMATAIRAEGGWNIGIVAATYNLGFGAEATVLTTSSEDGAGRWWIEGGIRFQLFAIIRIGISARIELRVVLVRPARVEFHLAVRLETPWFLPDVTFTLDCAQGTIAPASLSTVVSPITLASANERGSARSNRLHVERFDLEFEERARQRAPSAGDPRTFSIEELRAPAPAEAELLARFEGAAPAPVATDATIAVDFAVAVNDQIGIGGSDTAGRAGDQSGGDLSLRYDLVEVRVRRRARFGADRAWQLVDQRRELTGEGGALSGGYGPTVISKSWDPHVQGQGGVVAKRLLLNAVTPFELLLRDPVADETLAQAAPSWPCCPLGADEGRATRVHRVEFAKERLGAPLAPGRTFDGSSSRLAFPAGGRVRQSRRSADRVAALGLDGAACLLRAPFDEDAASARLVLAWEARPGARLVILGISVAGEAVFETAFELWEAADEVVVNVSGGAPLRRVEVWLDAGKPVEAPEEQDLEPGPPELELRRAEYVSQRDHQDAMRAALECDPAAAAAGAAFRGRGKVFLLPNHDYEIGLAVRFTAAHPSRPPEAATVMEYVYARTKGPIGLNAGSRVGEEVEPYVDRAYAPPRLYREEPLALSFKEGLNLALPLEARDPATGAEEAQLVRLELAVVPERVAATGDVATATAQDWIVAHRPRTVSGAVEALLYARTGTIVVTAPRTSAEPQRERLAAFTQHPDASCGLPDPRAVDAPVLVAPPPPAPGDPARAAPAWPGQRKLRAAVRMAGAPFVDRASFVEEDVGAFDRTGAGAWAARDGRLVATAGGGRASAAFGDASWDHVTVEVDLERRGRAAGVGVAYATGGRGETGLVAAVEAGALAIYRLGRAEPLASEPLPAGTPASVLLRIDVFDDVVRASVGEVRVEAERGDQRAGRLALVADGDATFGSLRVAGLELFAFPAQTSRYRSFGEHVGSFRGAVGALAPDAMGAGTTTATVEDLHASTREAVAAAMRPGAAAEARQDLFDRWVRELGLALRPAVDGLEVTRFGSGTEAQLLLLESPEPLDLTGDVWLRLLQKVPGLWEAIETQVLQDGAGERALIWAMAGGAPRRLSSGAYSLELFIDRVRYATSAADPLSRYADTQAIRVGW